MGEVMILIHFYLLILINLPIAVIAESGSTERTHGLIVSISLFFMFLSNIFKISFTL